MKEIGFFSFLLGERWKPGNNIFGIFPMIMGSIYVTAGAIVIGVPIGILTSIFMAEYCPKKIYPFLKSATELLAGIPSVVYGFFGLVVLVPLIRGMFREGNGSSMLTASILTPLGLYKEGEVEAVHVTTVDGETTILSNHMPIVAMLKTCKCTLSEHKEQKDYALAGGLLQFADNEMRILTDAVEGREEIDIVYNTCIELYNKHICSE